MIHPEIGRLVAGKGAPVLFVIAGPNGAGKSTYHAESFASLDLPFVNADLIKLELARKGRKVADLEAAGLAEKKRREYLGRKKSFCMETVFSDSKGAKRAFLREARDAGYTVVLAFIGLSRAALSHARVISRVMAGGHPVPFDRLDGRYARSLENLRLAIPHLDHAFLLDNSSFDEPYRLVAVCRDGEVRQLFPPIPLWARQALPQPLIGTTR